MTLDNPRKREANESPSSDTNAAPKRQRASTSSAEASMTFVLDNIFAFLLQQPDHALYSQHVARLVDDALDKSDLHDPVTKPLERLLQAIQQRCSGSSDAEGVLLATVKQQYVESVIQRLEASMGSISGVTSQTRVGSLEAGNKTITLELTITGPPGSDNKVKIEPQVDDSISAPPSSRSKAGAPSWHQPRTFTAPRFGMPSMLSAEQPEHAPRASIVNEPFRGFGGNALTFSAVSGNVEPLEERARSLSLAPSRPSGEATDGRVPKAGARAPDLLQGSDDKVLTIEDPSHGADGSLFLSEGKIIEHNAIGKPEMKLGLKKVGGLQDSTQFNKAFLENALRVSLGRKIILSSVIPYDAEMMVACFMDQNTAARSIGHELTVFQSTFKLIKLEDPSSRVFVCSGLPIGAEALTEQSLLHSLEHLFADQAHLHVKMGRTQSALAGHGDHTVLVALNDPGNIKRFSFSLELKSGSNKAAETLCSCVFEAVDIGSGACCVVCNSHAHTTIKCPSLKTGQ